MDRDGAGTLAMPVAGPPPQRIAAVRAAATAWSAQLIDLGGRNTLLHYRDLTAGTLDLTTAEPKALNALLDGRTTRLAALFPGEALADAARRARTLSAKARENFEERGLSTLYLARGMATWNSQGTTTATPAAPVLLAQLSLRPVGALETDFELAVIDEWEPNPTLLHLLHTAFHVDLDPDDLLTDAESGDIKTGDIKTGDAAGPLDAAGTALVQAASVIDGFAVTTRTVAGNFSYAKQPMVLDLEAGLDVMVDNDVIAALAGDRDAIAALRAAQIGVGLDQPDHTPPAEEFLAIDADASQHYVINAALAGANLVVQGPPGTGKSQTIANLIAVLSARGRSVLFVAEKRAAIDAVVNRLNRAGLGDLVLDLHGGGGSRRKMAAELRRVYEATATVPPVHRDSDDVRLVDLRNRLNRHSLALHAVRTPWQASVYDLQARLLGVPDALHVPMRIAGAQLAQVDAQTLRQLADALADWVTTGGPAVERRSTPWAAAAETIISSQAADTALNIARSLRGDTLAAAVPRLQTTLTACGLRRPPDVSGWGPMLALLRQVADVSARLQPAIWQEDLAVLAADLQPATKGVLGRAAAALFNGRYRRARQRAGALAQQPCTPRELYGTVAVAGTARREWAAQSTDGSVPRLSDDLAGTTAAHQRLMAELSALGAFVGTAGLLDADTGEIARRLDALLGDVNTLFRLPTLHSLATDIDQRGFGAVRRYVSEHDLDAAAGRQVAEYVWCASVLEQIQLTDPDVGAFDGATHSGYVAEFGSSDRNQVAAGAAMVRRAVAEHLVDVRNAHPESDALVAAEVRKKTRHRTLRELTKIAPEVLLALKPCWAMSPLAVSQLLDATQLFDVVIFDEASQVPPADAIPALMRARQAIVAGDSKQLPPTAFFASTSSDDRFDANGGDAENLTENLTEGTESVLDAMANVVTAGATTLRWHYRSRDERLIAFSNAQASLYDWQMVTFPGTTRTDAIRHVHVAGTGEDSSTAEVFRVVELITEHAKSRPEQSLGVIAMGINHAERIGEVLRRARHEDPVLDAFCATLHPAEPLFVKNLERVQGDERDAIILTVGYGKSSTGAMQYRFGPINQQGGERRLNVAITRARAQMTVVSAFLPTDLDPARLKSEGAQMLGRYVAYAASGGSDLGPGRREHPPLNPFEADVRDRLQAAGLAVTAQLGVSGYWIDFAARHPERGGQHVLAIEADGAGYHSSATARERDRLRQEHLERLGWRYHRIWSTDWFRDREAEITKVVAAWRAACAAVDSVVTLPSPPGPSGAWSPPSVPAVSLAAPLPPSAQRTGQRPRIVPGESIGEYTDEELVSIVTWVASDGLLRADSELHTEVRDEMGYQRRGPLIVERIDRAIDEFRRREEQLRS